MFERFTDRARRVVVLAQEEARQLDHNYIGTEHILLGLIREGDGVAAKALESLKISLETVRQKVEESVGRGERPPSGHIPFTRPAKKTLELALREALQMGHNYIGTEHILLGLIREGDGEAAQVLAGLGADLDKVRQTVIQLLHGHQTVSRGGRLGEFRQGIDTILHRLAVIERKLELGPMPEALRESNRRIAQVGKDKESAIDAMNFERAAELRETEKQLLRERDEEEAIWLAGAKQPQAEPAASGEAAGSGEPAASGEATASGGGSGELERMRAEVERLRALLREHGVEPD
jgi:ATP-dependent Clp protease ATP-binding subunit ClpA